MVVTILTKEQVEQQKELLKFYKYVYMCNKCKILYGSDFLDTTYLCPTHSKIGENFKCPK